MLVRSLIRGNAAAAKSRRRSQEEKRYVTSARGQANFWREIAEMGRPVELK
jgi:predicted DNA-binding ribbon-helix-helix protein